MAESTLKTLLKHDVHSLSRGPAMFWNLLFFMVLVHALLGIGLAPESGAASQRAITLSGGLALILTLLPLQQNLFAHPAALVDIEQLILSGKSLAFFAVLKSIAVFLSQIFPLLFCGLLLAWLEGVPLHDLANIALPWGLAGLALAPLALFLASLTLGRSNPLLLAALYLPLSIPLFVLMLLGSSNTPAALWLLAALAVLFTTLLPFASATLWRQAVADL